MDINKVREHAQGHADAMVAGDLRRAGGDLSESGRAAAPEVMKQIPRSLDSARVDNVAEDGEEATAVIVYAGEGREVRVLSRWSETDGRSMITDLKMV